jgi:hypothetical protein
MTKRLSWDKYTDKKVSTSTPGLFVISQEVLDLINSHLNGIYIYTKKSSYAKKNWKTGQTTVGAINRIQQQMTSCDEPVVIVFFIPTDIVVVDSKFDQKIHRKLHYIKDNGVEWLNISEPEESPGVEWSRYKFDNPIELWKEQLSGIQNRKPLSLTICQLETVDKLITALDSGVKKLIAELCARFGKTNTFTSLFTLIPQQVMVVCAYYTSSFSSFVKEVYEYTQFENIDIHDLRDLDFEKNFNASIFAGKKVIVIASLHDGKNLNKNVEIISKFTDKITVTDEADYGCHTEKVVPKVNRIGQGGMIILTTGTNSDRARGDHGDIEMMIKVSYFDMLAMRECAEPIIQNKFILDHYQRAVKFEQKLAVPLFFRFDYSKFVPVMDGFEEYAPSFAKCSADVRRAQSFWDGHYASLIGCSDDMDANCMNIFNLLRQQDDEVKDVIEFVSMKNKQMKDLCDIANSVLGKYFDVHYINGKITKNEKAEKHVEQLIEKARKKGKRAWIIASSMCQRSFSVPSINVTVLSYDRGDQGASVQKISRGLTPNKDKLKSYIISLSIDGNRDDKISSIMFDTAETLAQREGITMPQGLRKVEKVFSIFQNDPDGYVVPLTADEYTKEIFNTSNISRLVINKNNLKDIVSDPEFLQQLHQILTSKTTKNKVQVDFGKVNTFMEPLQRNGFNKNDESQMYQEILEILNIIVDRITYVSNTIKVFDKDLTYDKFLTKVKSDLTVSDTIGVSYDVLNHLVDRNCFNKNLLEMLFEIK